MVQGSGVAVREKLSESTRRNVAVRSEDRACVSNSESEVTKRFSLSPIATIMTNFCRYLSGFTRRQ